MCASPQKVCPALFSLSGWHWFGSAEKNQRIICSPLAALPPGWLLCSGTKPVLWCWDYWFGAYCFPGFLFTNFLSPGCLPSLLLLLAYCLTIGFMANGSVPPGIITR